MTQAGEGKKPATPAPQPAGGKNNPSPFDTEAAINHLRSKGYRVFEPTPDLQLIRITNLHLDGSEPVRFTCDYTNWRGVTSERHLRPMKFWLGSTDWHPEPGLMLTAIDLEKNESRDFRVADFDISTLRGI